MAAMATTTFTSSLSSNPKSSFSSFHGKPISPRTTSIKSTTPQNATTISMSLNSPAYDLQAFKFSPIKKSIGSREMTRRYMTDMITYADTDVVML
ncbi:thiamine thiazole synthase, chloroplastic-like [Lotus japonicus]|uniref:thiamine thiazole synthase, chloroplastic-like n=1 Tax=Lotus japonicus TaxID=34305 RepID=UPI002588C98C|nr:thiamine thiazole synthase, chloroplastic-like [Lotus japonicus]